MKPQPSGSNNIRPTIRKSGRLIFINRYFYPDHSATAQILTDLSAFLSEQGWSVHILTSRGLYGSAGTGLEPHETLKGVQVHRVWTSPFGRKGLIGRCLEYLTFYLATFVALMKLCRRGDIIIAKTDPPLVSVIADMVARLRGVRLVNWLQDLYPEVAAELGVAFLRGPIGACIRHLRNRGLRNAVSNVVISARMAARLSAEGVPAGRIRVIPNWSADEDITPSRAQDSSLREVWGLKPREFVLGYSGNLGRAHEVQTLLGAARLLRLKPDIKFLFIGGGHYTEELMSVVTAEGLTSFIFRPYQPVEKLGESLAVPDVHWVSLRPELEGLILPSKFYGIAAAARPIIAVTDSEGELALLVQEHRCGLAVATGDSQGLSEAILALAADRAECEAMGLRARLMLDKHYTRASSQARWHGLFSELMGLYKPPQFRV